ncbi:hypothetical protein PSTG_00645 [Puccinia striiformis f. sp. tritici PST-78]|uniref:RNA-dependent RNA polymerase n=1 Tax=Puccinia striiformis f. sp. tritici PST-78 TaxID=1165861 RepID=A0A0L0W4D6_9BASI|nr:hypothetical protein PSTG_00645 [Puccinia striiformis f. sp. tritici PST-78]
MEISIQDRPSGWEVDRVTDSTSLQLEPLIDQYRLELKQSTENQSTTRKRKRTQEDDDRQWVSNRQFEHSSSPSELDFVSKEDDRALLASIDFGILNSEGSFSSEYHRSFNSAGFKDRASVLIDSQTPQLIIHRVYQDEEDQLTLISIRTINRIELNQTSVLLFLDHPPTFHTLVHDQTAESIRATQPFSYLEARQLLSKTSDHKPFIKTRSSGFDEDHKRIISYASNLIKLEFIEQNQSSKFLHQSRLYIIPKIIPLRRDIAWAPIYTSSNLSRVDSITSDLDLIVGFQLESLLYNLLLNPIDIIAIRPWIIDLDPIFAERILMRLGCELTQPSLTSNPGVLLAQKFEQAKLKTDEKSLKWVEERLQKEGNFKCRSVTITPTRTILEGPIIEQGNSILRLYDYNSAFIRVSIREEDGSLLRFERDVDLAGFLKDRYRPLADQLLIAGRPFEFLCYSSSALKSHQAWFVCPFIHRGQLVNASKIRDRMGCFSTVNKIPARYMARVAQAFTTTKKAITLQPSQIKIMDDVIRNGSVFTDGVGSISCSLAKKVQDSLRTGSSEKQELDASCYQIRLGGYKGMISIDNTLDGDIVRLRPSMRKFEGESFTLDIVESFNHPFPAFLNRPLIKILEDLKIPAPVFLMQQRKYITKIEDSRSSLHKSSLLMNQIGLGKSINLSQILKYLSQLMGTDNPSKLNGLTKIIEDCLNLMVVNCLKDLKFNARIPLPNSYNLVGIIDEDYILQDREIYVCIERVGSKRIYIEGRVGISRSPSLHPGDFQLVTAIGKPPSSKSRLDSLVNCVVFPLIGKRSLSSCLAGGDLDGDLYTVIVDSQFIPHPDHIYQPGDYEPPEMISLDNPCSISDGIDFFLDYIVNDNVGIIAHRHVLIADSSPLGVLDNRCLKLTELHSRAVDYPKTGMAVSMDEIPRSTKGNMKPDFMCPELMFTPSDLAGSEEEEEDRIMESYWKNNPANSRDQQSQKNQKMYYSSKVLGLLYRQIPPSQIHRYQQRLSPDLSARGSSIRNDDLGVDPDGVITHHLLQHIHILYPDFLHLNHDHLWNQEIHNLLEEFMLDLNKISQVDRLTSLTHYNHLSQDDEHNHSPNLLEVEIIMGLILKDNGKLGKVNKKDQTKKLQNHSRLLFESLRSSLVYVNGPYGSFGEDEWGRRRSDFEVAGRAWIGWNLVVNRPAKAGFGRTCFGLVCLDVICSVLLG